MLAAWSADVLAGNGSVVQMASGQAIGIKTPTPTGHIRRLRIDRLCLDFQPHENLINDTVTEYMDCMRRREKIDPVEVCFDGTNYNLKDRFHRVQAAIRLGRKTILA